MGIVAMDKNDCHHNKSTAAIINFIGMNVQCMQIDCSSNAVFSGLLCCTSAGYQLASFVVLLVPYDYFRTCEAIFKSVFKSVWKASLLQCRVDYDKFSSIRQFLNDISLPKDKMNKHLFIIFYTEK